MYSRNINKRTSSFEGKLPCIAKLKIIIYKSIEAIHANDTKNAHLILLHCILWAFCFYWSKMESAWVILNARIKFRRVFKWFQSTKESYFDLFNYDLHMNCSDFVYFGLTENM